MGRDHPEVAAQLLQCGIGFEQAAGAMQKEQRLTAATGEKLDRKTSAANTLLRLHLETSLEASASRGALEGAAPAPSTGAGRARSHGASGWGDQRSWYSLHKPRRCGITSRANSSVLMRVTSDGIEPNCNSAIRCPQRSVLSASVSRSRTVRGEPAMM